MNRKTIHCSCYDPTHWMYLELVEHDDEWQGEYGSVSICIGRQFMPLRYRLRNLWSYIRYGRDDYAEMILERQQVRQLRAALDNLTDSPHDDIL